MSTIAASLTRDPFMPRRPVGMRAGLVLALLAHVLLIAGLAFSVDWHGSEPAPVEAELWSALPQQAAPRAMAPEPPQTSPLPKQVVRPVEQQQSPLPRPQPTPQPPVDPQIATEKARQARQEEAQRELADQERSRRDRARREQLRQNELQRLALVEHDRKQAQEHQAQEQRAREDQAHKKLPTEKAEKEKSEKDKSEKEKADQSATAARAAYLQRMQGLAGANGDSGSTGTAVKSSGPSSGYGGRIMARIKPNIVFPDAVEGNPTATVEVRVAPDGTITSRRLARSSGVKAWDDAVLRAIDRTDGLPRDLDGRVPPVIMIDFKRD